MIAPNPNYLLFCTTHLTRSMHPDCSASPGGLRGRWHFVLERLDSNDRLEVADSEPNVTGDRLALLCIVRGLEALEGPARVALVTTSRYVSRGLRYGLSAWREKDYCWERFGVQKPIRNADLWKRVDGAMSYHAINCRLINPSAAVRPQPVLAGQANSGLGDSVVLDSPASSTPQLAGVPDLPTELAAAQAAELALASRVADAENLAAGDNTRPAGWLSGRLKAGHKAAGGWQEWMRGRLQPKPALLGT